MGLFDSIFAGGGIGGFNPFGILGETNQDVKAKTAQNQANQYLGNSAGYYGQIGQYGQNAYLGGQGLLDQVLSAYNQNAGLTSTPQSGLNPYQYLSGVPSYAAGVSNSAALPNPAPGGRTPNTGQTATLPGAQPPQGADQPNPYSLTPAQQMQLNQEVSGINARRQNALAQLRAGFAQRGISDPRAMAAAEADIHNSFDTLASNHQAQFAQNAQQARQQALQQLLGVATGQTALGQQGMNSAAGGFAGLGGAAQQNANYQQQQANALGNSGLQLLGFGLSGGFGGFGGGHSPVYSSSDILNATNYTPSGYVNAAANWPGW